MGIFMSCCLPNDVHIYQVAVAVLEVVKKETQNTMFFYSKCSIQERTLHAIENATTASLQVDNNKVIFQSSVRIWVQLHVTILTYPQGSFYQSHIVLLAFATRQNNFGGLFVRRFGGHRHRLLDNGIAVFQ